MCYDQEKTQGSDPRSDPRVPFEVQQKLRAERAAQAAFQDRVESAGQIGGRAFSEAEILAELFKYHPPNEVTLPKFAAINQAAKNFAEVILQNCPPGADRSDAIRKIREARMTANAAVALNGLSL
jgi:hypothetical protein